MRIPTIEDVAAVIDPAAQGSRVLLDTLAGSAAPPEERTERYLLRVDLHLTDNCDTDQQRLQFLSAQLAGWNRAYAKFVSRNGGELDPPNVPEVSPAATASDYLLTILGLSARQEQVRARVRAEREVAR